MLKLNTSNPVEESDVVLTAICKSQENHSISNNIVIVRTTRLLPAETVATSARPSSVTSVLVSASRSTSFATVFSMPRVSCRSAESGFDWPTATELCHRLSDAARELQDLRERVRLAGCDGALPSIRV